MSKDDKLAKIENGKITEVYDELRLPIYIQRTRNLEHWLEKRAIDSHRRNSRLLKKALRLQEKDDISTVLSVNAACITDTYWIKEEESNTNWTDVHFSNNYFADLALKGDISAFELEPSKTPEVTNIGSFEKCWKLEDGKWWMYKKANEMELFSELFIYYLGKELGFSMAHYEPDEGAIKSLDFTSAATVNYESAYGWMGENEDYVENYKCFENISSKIADQYVEIILMDSFCRNADRHTDNYGVFRDVDTGEIKAMAPNFDNNVALVYDGVIKERKPDLFGKLLYELDNETHAIENYLSRNNLPEITEKMIERCVRKTGINVDMEYIKHFVKTGWEQTPLSEYKKLELSEVCELATQLTVKNTNENTRKTHVR